MNPNLMHKTRRGAARPLPAGVIGLCRDGDGGAATLERPPMLEALYQERNQAISLMDAAVVQAREANRDLSDVEAKMIGDGQARVATIDKQIKLIEDLEQLRSAGNSAAQTFRPTSGGAGQQGQPTAANGLGARTNPRAGDYQTAGQVVVDHLRAAGYERNSAPDPEARDRLLGAGLEVAGETRAITNETTANVPGLLPQPIIGNIVNQIDDRRPFISSIGARDLGGVPGKVFSRPIVTQHTLVGQQVAEKTELASQQMVVGSVDFTKNTYGGAVDVSRQVIDWTSPAAWDALLTDLQRVYGKFTENRAADDFAAAIIAEVEVGGAVGAHTFLEWATAMYAAAALVYGSVEELPNHVWMSLDMWASFGPVIDQYRTNIARVEGNTSSPTNFAGEVFDFPRTVVPSFPAGTMIVGVKELTEVYEDRIGLLTAVEPKLLGVEVAYGGYMANGTLDVDGFAKIVDEV